MTQVSIIGTGTMANAIGFLPLTLAAGEKIGWTGGFAVAR